MRNAILMLLVACQTLHAPDPTLPPMDPVSVTASLQCFSDDFAKERGCETPLYDIANRDGGRWQLVSTRHSADEPVFLLVLRTRWSLVTFDRCILRSGEILPLIGGSGGFAAIAVERSFLERACATGFEVRIYGDTEPVDVSIPPQVCAGFLAGCK